MKPRVSLIAAMSENRIIGRNNTIPWYLPRELKTFKAITMGHHIVMGRKTYESINRLLPGRTTVIITRDPNYTVAGALVMNSFELALEGSRDDDQVFVIGGAEIYRLALPSATRFYLTVVHAELPGDTYMPDLELDTWTKISSETFSADEKNSYDYTISVYER